MIEQPLAHDDLIDHAELQSRIETAVCLDESISSPARAEKAIRIGACRWMNIKHGRLGGLTQALEVHRICREADMPCWIGSMLESAVGTSFGLALAALPAVKYPSDLLPSRRFYEEDLGRPEIRLSGSSQIALSDRPGIGVDPDPDALERVTVDRAVVD
jgi:O-succinylbenzoate synthase